MPPQQTYSLHKVLKILLRYNHAYVCACLCVLICVCTWIYLYVGARVWICLWGVSPPSNLQYNARGQWLLQFVYKRTPVRLSADSWALSTKPATAYNYTSLLDHSQSKKLARRCHCESTKALQRQDGQAGGDWQALKYEGEYWEFTHNETCQFECLKASQWAGHDWRLRKPFLLRENISR